MEHTLPKQENPKMVPQPTRVDREPLRVFPTKEMPTHITSEFDMQGDEQKGESKELHRKSKNTEVPLWLNNGGENPKVGFI